MIAIFKREVRSSFHGMIGYVLTAFMLAATAIYFIALNLGYGLTDFGYYTLYRTVFVPIRRDSPKKAITLILAVLLGGMVGAGIVLGRNALRNYNAK